MRPLHVPRWVLTTLLLLFAAMCLIGEVHGDPLHVYVGKPAATLCILLIAVTAASRVSARYRALIVVGLLLGLVGDVLLMLPADLFVPGLASFLLGHLAYIEAFSSTGGGRRSFGVALGVAAVAAAMLTLLWPRLGDEQLPVVIYIGVIATMAWQAIARWRNGAGPGTAVAAAGAVAFMVSDSTLAIQRFIGEVVPAGSLVVSVTYWLAQYLIATSVGPARLAAEPHARDS